MLGRVCRGKDSETIPHWEIVRRHETSVTVLFVTCTVRTHAFRTERRLLARFSRTTMSGYPHTRSVASTARHDRATLSLPPLSPQALTAAARPITRPDTTLTYGGRSSSLSLSLRSWARRATQVRHTASQRAARTPGPVYSFFLSFITKGLLLNAPLLLACRFPWSAFAPTAPEWTGHCRCSGAGPRPRWASCWHSPWLTSGV